MRPVRTLSLMLILGLIAPFAPARAEDDGPPPDDRNFVQKALASVVLGPAYQTSTVILFPLLAPGDDPTIEVASSLFDPKVTYSEPELPRRRGNVLVTDQDARTAFVLGGLVLEGGERDRMITNDALVPGQGAAEVEALPSSLPSDTRRDPVAFHVSPSAAPAYLRRNAQFGGAWSLVPRFVSQFLDFRNEDDERASLAAINESQVLEKYCIPCHRSLDSFPLPKDGRRVVGFVVAVRGRIQSLELFGNTTLFAKHFETLLKGYTFTAAAIQIRAEKAGIPIPGRDDPEKTLTIVTKAAEDLIQDLGRARYRKDDIPDEQVGEAFLLGAAGGTRGRAVGLDGVLVHLSVFPHDPFANALYRSPIDPEEDEAYGGDEGLVELERRAAQGSRLTEAEKRLLERLGRANENRGLQEGRGFGGNVPRPSGSGGGIR